MSVCGKESRERLLAGAFDLPGEIAANEADHQVEVEGEAVEIDVVVVPPLDEEIVEGALAEALTFHHQRDLGEEPHRQVVEGLVIGFRPVETVTSTLPARTEPRSVTTLTPGPSHRISRTGVANSTATSPPHRATMLPKPSKGK